jgi:hypothetical protein
MTLADLNLVLKKYNIPENATIIVFTDEDFWELSIVRIFYNKISNQLCICGNDENNINLFDHAEERFKKRDGWKQLYYRDEWKTLFD